MHQKSFVHDKWAMLGPKMAHPHNSGSVDENDFNNFPKKYFVWGKWTILGQKMAHPRNSGPAVRIFLNFAQ